MERIVENIMQENEKLLSQPQPDQNIQSYGRNVRLSQVKRYMRRNNSPSGRHFASTAPPTPRFSAADGRHDRSSMFVTDTMHHPPDAMRLSRRGAPLEASMSSSLPDLGSGSAWTDASNSRPDNRDLLRTRVGTLPEDGEHGENENAELFACPYFKFDPLRYSPRNAGTENTYRRCSAVVIKTISALKQHLYRAHKRPEYYCCFCYADFPEQYSRDVHTRNQSCQVQEDPFVEKMTDEQYKQIKRRKGATDQQEGWYEIYSILFPGHRQPASPYNDDQGSITHLVNLFRALGPSMARDLYCIARGEDSEDHLAEALPAATQLVMDGAYDIFLSTSKALDWDQNPVRKWSDSSTLTLSTRQSSVAGGEVYSFLDYDAASTFGWTDGLEGNLINGMVPSEEPFSIATETSQDWTMVERGDEAPAAPSSKPP